MDQGRNTSRKGDGSLRELSRSAGTAGLGTEGVQGVAAYLPGSPYTSASIFSGSRGHVVSRTWSPMAPGFPSSYNSPIPDMESLSPNSKLLKDYYCPGFIQCNQWGSRERSEICPHTAPENVWLGEVLQKVI